LEPTHGKFRSNYPLCALRSGMFDALNNDIPVAFDVARNQGDVKKRYFA
jgi:hypothetical protein